MTARVKSHARAIKAKIRGENKKRLREAARIVKDRARVLLGVSGTGKILKGRLVRARTARGKNTIVGAFRSRPGEPPLKQTGKLRRSVRQLLLGSTRSRVYTDVFYGRILDSPKYRAGRRPWLKRALDDMSPAIKSLLTRRMDLT